MQKPSSSRTEFSAALAQIAHERNLDPKIVVEAIKQAILAAFKKDHPTQIKEDNLYEVELNSTSGEAQIWEIEGETSETEGVVSIIPKSKGSRTEVTPPGFGRIAAQTAKQVILQKIREAEKSAVIAEYEKRLGTLVSGMILRFMGSDIMVDIGKAEAMLPSGEQIPSESYHLNQRLTFFLDSIRETPRGREVIVSRANPNLVKELFRREVPEVGNSAVEVKAIARDPGSRTKIAVYSHQSGVDPVGSCVGQKGVRVQAVINELNGEKIDIVQYNEDLDKFIAAALSPATGLTVVVNSQGSEATVSAPADQLSLAIGREGQNAKLAGRLTGLHIDIKAAKETPAEAGTHEAVESDSNDQIPNPKSQ